MSFFKFGFNKKLSVQVFGKLSQINVNDFITIETSQTSGNWIDWLRQHHLDIQHLYQDICPFLFNETMKSETVVGIIEPSSDGTKRVFPFSLYLVFSKKLIKHSNINLLLRCSWLYLLNMRNKIMTLRDYQDCYSYIRKQSFDIKTQLQMINEQNHNKDDKFNEIYYPNNQTWPHITLYNNYSWEF